MAVPVEIKQIQWGFGNGDTSNVFEPTEFYTT